MLVACVTILALILARLLGRPLRKLADAADRVGREDVTPAAEEGPREVRRVAAAFNAMQARLLDQVNERIQALAAVSHDLRTPIARLRLRAANVRNQELRAAIGHDIDEMEAFMRSILDFLRGADPEEERLIDLASLVVTIVHDAQDMGSAVHYEGPASLELVTRPIKLQRAIDNLVQNAIRHAGQAEIRLSQGDDGVRIVVEDQGPGIPVDQLDMVFEPFRRLEGSRNRNTGGAGLGLAIVRRSITRLGGSIRLENRRRGGLRATITL
ncbi:MULTISPECIES: ATP-binding protein [Sphingobium]|nr:MULTISPECIES: ATP-binding protein [Sphingobium]WRD78386.1 ATP-binding protein [Sphingobium baderi]